MKIGEIEVLLSFIVNSKLVSKRYSNDFSVMERSLFEEGLIERKDLPDNGFSELFETCLTSKGLLRILEYRNLHLPSFEYGTENNEINTNFLICTGTMEFAKKLMCLKFNSEDMFKALKQIYPKRIYAIKQKNSSENRIQIFDVYWIDKWKELF